ncbi:MAG: hypothetical protein ABJE66_15160 [Deltaproteobacteria bacterium]
MTIEHELGVVLALARDAIAVPALRDAAGHADARIRLLAQLGLARAGDREAGVVEDGLADESELACYYVLAARAGLVALGPTALDYLAAQAAYEPTPAALRASCVWALGEHEPRRARTLVAALDGDATDHFIAIVRARGGGFAASHGALATPHVDRVALLVGQDRWRRA